MAVAELTKLEKIDLTPRIGTEVRADKATLLSGAVGREIRETLEARGVVLIRAIDFTDEEQSTFTATMGSIAENGFRISMDKTVQPLAEYTKGAFYWHIDGATTDMPIFASVMSGRTIATEGGQTEFANTYAAYDDLPPSEQKALEAIRVVHDLEASQRYVNPEPTYATMMDWQRYRPNTLPLVWKHRDGRKSLILGASAANVEGMSMRDSWNLLTRLRDHATQSQFVYSHEWTAGDCILWDNTGTMHRVRPYAFDSGRLMYRTTIEGDEPFAWA